MRPAENRTTRLLPWTGPEGKPCYLLTDDRGGPVSRVADNVESVQIGMGNELLLHADALLAERGTAPDELRYLSGCLTESLRDVLRIAESRGARLGGPGGTVGADEAATETPFQ
ncbi:hypothetical protein [Streptomyces sp. NPDC006274]|uniref:hypothetical protein n=1 Tax=unclassified Streptomyces TaxID=2593676 RepID=UPI00339EE634